MGMRNRPTNHVFRHRMPKRVPWLVTCRYCGLVELRNEATRREMRKPCKSRIELTDEEEDNGRD